MSHKPVVFSRRIRLSPPHPGDKTADVDRLLAALETEGLAGVSIPIDLVRRLPGELRRQGFEIDLVIGAFGKDLAAVDCGLRRIFGIALDIGSTNMECSLFDLGTGERLLVREAENPQISFGSDVLTRVQESMTGRFEPLVRALRDGVNRLIGEVCVLGGAAREEIVAVTVAGNTIMTHFFLGLDVNNIPLSPYIPVVNSPVFLTGREAGLVMNGNGLVYVFPNAGSYVGGDIISGIIASDVDREESPVLFIDVGTNVEVTLGCSDWIMTGAGAAGPALEGGVAGIGKKAEPGTICKVSIDRTTGTVESEVIPGPDSGTSPQGICGSGLIDLVAEMFHAGIIDQTGKFTDTAAGIVERDGVRAFTVYRSGDTELLLTENEIKNFLVSKAAMFSFLYVFVRSVGLTFSDIRKVFVAGALGCGIDPERAVRIGLLPDIPRERFIPVGNSSLAGAEMVLLDRDLLTRVERVASMVTYREMNEDSDLMSVLQGAMFIPHTDPELLRG
ncbi:MAG: ASKHA domain-containing protein [Nitrospiraceae bacterium]|nr:ASKHA domain-containing protein [Nitrospiraceae bacterium]